MYTLSPSLSIWQDSPFSWASDSIATTSYQLSNPLFHWVWSPLPFWHKLSVSRMSKLYPSSPQITISYSTMFQPQGIFGLPLSLTTEALLHFWLMKNVLLSSFYLPSLSSKPLGVNITFSNKIMLDSLKFVISFNEHTSYTCTYLSHVIIKLIV